MLKMKQANGTFQNKTKQKKYFIIISFSSAFKKHNFISFLVHIFVLDKFVNEHGKWLKNA